MLLPVKDVTFLVITQQIVDFSTAKATPLIPVHWLDHPLKNEFLSGPLASVSNIFRVRASILDQLTHCQVVSLHFFDELSLNRLTCASSLAAKSLRFKALRVAKSAAVDCFERRPHHLLLLWIDFSYWNVDHLVNRFLAHESFNDLLLSSQFLRESKLHTAVPAFFAPRQVVQISRPRFLWNKPLCGLTVSIFSLAIFKHPLDFRLIVR